MKRLSFPLFLLVLAGCGQKAAEAPAVSGNVEPSQTNSATLRQAPVAPPVSAPPPAPALTQKGVVSDVIKVPQYTYIEVTQDNTKRWLAALDVTVNKGDRIRFDEGTVMNNFTSHAINRTFPSITFVAKVVVDNK